LKADDIETVVIGGRIVMQDRHVLTIDTAQVIARACEYAATVEKSLQGQ
jgi:hypothetical protein